MSCFMDNIQMLPLSVAARSDAWFCGCLHAGISVSSPAGSMDFFYVFLEVSATGRSLVQRSHTECDVSNYFDRGKSKRRSRPTIGFRAMRKIFKYCFEFNRIFFPPILQDLRFLQRCCWCLKSSAMWRRVIGWVNPDSQNDCFALFFSVKQYDFNIVICVG